MFIFLFNSVVFISIHALVKRATFFVCSFAVHLINFNPRPREEGDFINFTHRPQINYFNPRPREEGDAVNNSYCKTVCDFNPRPREEGDSQAWRKSRLVSRFQSTPS